MSRLTMRYPFYIGLTTLVVLIVLVLSGSFLWISHRESNVAALRQADRLFAEINAKILGRLENDLNGVANLVNSASRAAGMSRRPIGDGLDHPGLNLMLGALASHPQSIFDLYRICGWQFHSSRRHRPPGFASKGLQRTAGSGSRAQDHCRQCPGRDDTALVFSGSIPHHHRPPGRIGPGL